MWQLDINRLKEYAVALLNLLPSEVYEGMASILAFGLLSIVLLSNKRNLLKYIAMLLSVEYYFLVLSSTVIFRKPSDTRTYEMTPLWTYQEILNGSDVLQMEIQLNILVFVPLGYLLVLVFGVERWWKALYWGMAASCTIEFLQLLLKRGFCETDDLIHNTIGCALGVIIYVFFVKICSCLLNYSKSQSVIKSC